MKIFKYQNNNKLLIKHLVWNLLKTGKRAFANSGITEITIPVNMVEIGERCFSDCKSLKKMDYNAEYCESPTTLSGSAFFNSAITNFVIGDDVHHLPSYLLYRV